MARRSAGSTSTALFYLEEPGDRSCAYARRTADVCVRGGRAGDDRSGAQFEWRARGWSDSHPTSGLTVVTDTDALYQEIILEHNRKPRNFRVMPDATVRWRAHNPMCGDAAHLVDQAGRRHDRRCELPGRGCAISKASASMMTAAVKGKTRAEARGLSSGFTIWSPASCQPTAEGARIAARVRRRLAVSVTREMREPRLAHPQVRARLGSGRRHDRPTIRRRAGTSGHARAAPDGSLDRSAIFRCSPPTATCTTSTRRRRRRSRAPCSTR